MTHPDALQERALRAIDSEKADALAKAFCLLDSFAGDGLGHVYGNGQTIDADDTVLELCSAFDCDPEPGWWRELAYEMLDTLSTPPVHDQGLRDALERARHVSQCWQTNRDPADAQACAKSLVELLVALPQQAATHEGEERAEEAARAWKEVAEIIEAHLQDRVAMRDEANPETYLRIVQSAMARVDHSTKQLLAARWATEKRLRDEVERLSTPTAQQGGEEADRIEACAQWLHDEGGFDDAWTQHTWPEHPGDTGQRDSGFVKIVPSDVQAKFREVATRLLKRFPEALSAQQAAGEAEAVKGEESALSKTARRNLRTFINGASFKCINDRDAALACVDVLDSEVGGLCDLATVLRDALRAYETLATPQPTETQRIVAWQGIESAPRDGTVIDLWVRPYNGQARRAAGYWWLESEQVWRTDLRKDDLSKRWTPTHWMPTPDGPTSGEHIAGEGQ